MAWVYEDRNVPKYPHLEYLEHIRPDPHLVLGRRIDWTLKEDGSNCGIYLNENDELTVRSRNMDVCDGAMLEAFKRTGFYEAAEESLFSARQWGLDYVIFGELMTKGKSPTRIKFYDKDDFKVFDIFTQSPNGESDWMNYVRMAQECNHAGLPFVDHLGTSISKSMDHLNDKISELMTLCRETRQEGVVGKLYDLGIFFKAKTDTPPMKLFSPDEEEGKIVLPPLADSDLYGAIEKVRESIGNEAFLDKRLVMPLIAKAVSDECASHYRSKPLTNLFEAYQVKCRELLAG